MLRTALLVALAGLVIAPVAWAGPQVPEVTVDQLSVAGTCAPIEGPHLTWLTLGEPGWFRLNENLQDVDGAAVAAHLRDQAGRAATDGTRADVWIVAARNRPWGQIVQLLELCEQNGIFRVGLQVRSESGLEIMGFPLFLPAPTDAISASTAPTGRALKVRVVRPIVSPLKAPVRSHPSRLYVATQRAVQAFGPVVATVSIRRDVTVQDAVRTLDLLWRAGCAGVRLPVLIMAHRQAEPYVELYVQGRLLEADPIDIDLPPVAPRRTPWPDQGAAQPGAYAWKLEPIPTRGEVSPEEAKRLEPLPTYTGSPQGVPPQAMASSETTIRRWGESLGLWLTRALGPPPINLPETLLVRRKRQGLGAQHFFQQARLSFRNPESVTVGTVRLVVYLVQGVKPVGRVDLTVSLAGERVGVVFASWLAEQAPQDFILPPRETDPYAPGIPGYFRIWLEGTLAAARAGGAAALPLAGEAEVLAQFPAVARPSVQGALARRSQGIENLVAWLRATPYDRLFVAAAEGSAAVRSGGRVLGILRFFLEAERGEMSLVNLTPRVAPR